MDFFIETSYHANNFDYEIKYLDTPEKFGVKVMNIHCLFSGKINAILTRNENAERDWYDLNWYIEKGIEPKFEYLSKKLDETGPFAGKGLRTDTELVKKLLLEKEKELDYDMINKLLNSVLKENNRVDFNRDYMKNKINDLGKDGYKIKYNIDEGAF